MAPRMAYLGMGAMGQAMARNLIQRGELENPLTLWNRTYSKAMEHSANIGHSVVKANIAEAVADADIIWTCLASQDAILECFEKILKEDVKNKLFVDCSTIAPGVTNDLAAKMHAVGAEFVAMPVFGEPSMANAAMLTCVPAGPKYSVEKVLPYVNGVIARAHINLSDRDPGTASHLKLIGNILILNMIEAVAEAHVLAEKTGLENDVMDSSISTLFPGPCAIYSKKMVSGAYHKAHPMVHIDMAISVASHVLGLAEKSGTKLAAYEEGKRHLDAVKDYAGSGGDISGIYGAVRMESGLPYEN